MEWRDRGMFLFFEVKSCYLNFTLSIFQFLFFIFSTIVQTTSNCCNSLGLDRSSQTVSLLFIYFSDTNLVETARVFNVIVPEPRSHFLNQLGYVLAIFLLLTLIVVAVILLTRSRRKRGTTGTQREGSVFADLC